MVVVKRIVTIAQIEDACALLYDEYIENMGWKFSEDNPSKLEVVEKNGRKLLIDRFTRRSYWFGAFEGKKLVGCARLSRMDESGKYEVQSYPTSKVVHKYLVGNCVEAGRVAVSNKCRGNKIIERLYLSLLEYAYDMKLNIFGCTANSYIKGLFNKINLPLLKTNVFKFTESDGSPVNFYLVNYDKNEYEPVIKQLMDIIKTKAIKYPMLDSLNYFASMTPVPMYWMDANGVVLGVNQLCLNGMGATRLDDVVGKTPYDFYPCGIARAILIHNKRVISTGEVLCQEEQFRYLDTGKVGYAKAIKSPLHDNDGNIIGILGVSIDITAEKEREQLKLQNIIYETKLEAQETLKNCLNDLQNLLQTTQRKISAGKNKKLYSKVIADDNDINLTKRQQEILYYLAMSKSPKEIATILGEKENKSLSPLTVSSIIDKQLYPKFGVSSVGSLIEKAIMLNLIPFVLE